MVVVLGLVQPYSLVGLFYPQLVDTKEWLERVDVKQLNEFLVHLSSFIGSIKVLHPDILLVN